MKLSLVVVTPGKMEGKSIPVTLSQFLIGRDPQCQLRPASALISKRHCALLIREEKAFVRDFDSTNGTSVNDDPVKGERELKDGDTLKVGPLAFRVALETAVPVDKPTPVPMTKSAAPTDDEAAAAMLLSLQDDGSAPAPDMPVDSDGIPTGSTVMEIMNPVTGESKGKDEDPKGAAARDKAAKAAQGNTSSAAKAILEKYMRRPRDRQ
ncbi:MAG TPA: FHA domain-containing protein [Gemmataceae bacterium]|jgi:pSer/pThr/pTyr-binding forkhead associated (FHA) protein|nr:FHA domain-containing protein [Gemmataceae bacterium]